MESQQADVPSASYETRLGPFYSSAGVMRLLKIPTKQALDDRRRRGTILAAQTADDVWVHPSFQFDPTAHSVRRELAPVLAALKNAPRGGAGLWLVTPHPELQLQAPAAACVDPTLRDLAVTLATQYSTAVAA